MEKLRPQDKAVSKSVDHFLNQRLLWGGGAQPIVGGATPGQVVLRATRKQAEQVTLSKPVINLSISPCPDKFQLSMLKCDSGCISQISPFVPKWLLVLVFHQRQQRNDRDNTTISLSLSLWCYRSLMKQAIKCRRNVGEPHVSSYVLSMHFLSRIQLPNQRCWPKRCCLHAICILKAMCLEWVTHHASFTKFQ